MKVKKLSNSSEIITYHEILRGLGGTNFLVFPKLAIKDVISDEVKNSLNKSQINLFNNSHFDFVVSTSNHIPLFAVEFDGPHHFIYEKKQLSDIRKNRICQIAQFPIIRVSDDHLQKFDNISIVQFIAYRFSDWQKNKNTDLNADQNYSFPTTIDLRNKLVDEYGLTYWFPKKTSEDILWFVIVPGNMGSRDGLFFDECKYRLYQGYSIENAGWSDENLENPSIKVLIEGMVRFSLKWALITAEDYDKHEPPIFYEQRNGFLPIYHGDIPGADLPSIVSAIVEYLAYRKLLEEIEKLQITNRKG